VAIPGALAGLSASAPLPVVSKQGAPTRLVGSRTITPSKTPPDCVQMMLVPSLRLNTSTVTSETEIALVAKFHVEAVHNALVGQCPYNFPSFVTATP